MPGVEDRLESGVSPLVGTVLVLGISVAGTAAALLLGAPALERLQEQAALDAMVAQFEAVREAQSAMSLAGDGRTLGTSLPSGVLRVEPGTRWLVTANQDPTYPLCDLRILDWADGDRDIHLDLASAGPCRSLVGNQAVDCLLAELPAGEATSACLEVYRVDGDTEVPVPIDSTTGTRIRLEEGLAADATYVLRLTDLETSVYTQAWLLPTDRLHWSGGRVGLDLEGGALVAHGRSGDRTVAPPRIDEGVSTAGPLLVVFPGLRAEHGTQVQGGGTQTMGLRLEASYVRHQGTAYLVRVDLAGQNAQPLCEALLQGSLDAAAAWEADTLTGECGTTGVQATVPVTEDDTVSATFNPANGPDAPLFVLTQQVFAVSLKP